MSDDRNLIERSRYVRTNELRRSIRVVVFMIGVFVGACILMFGLDNNVELTPLNIFLISILFLGLSVIWTLLLYLFERWYISRKGKDDVSDEW